jgi:murein DD-endopeptidase MepM/ murein hydrolase activator NlpD
MYSSLEEEILPYAHEWYYKDHLNSIRKASPIPQISSQSEYNMSGQLGLTFDKLPDKCTVKIYKSGIKVYDNDLSQLSSFSVDAGTNLQFDVSAEWNENDEGSFYGTVRYNFKVLVRDRANFLIDSTSVNTGEFAFVSCTNILDASKIKFTAEPSINCEPIFFEDNDTVRTILPISNDLKAGEYKLTFSYGATTETLVLKVNKSEPPKAYNFSLENTELVSSLTNKTNMDTVVEIINDLDFDNRIFVRGKFADYKDIGADALVKYGAIITSENGDITHNAIGTQFVWKDTKNIVVPSLNSGIVIKVGYCGYLGNYVVVDHGLGLRTVYAHLDTVFVKEGTVLSKLQQIGLGGSLNAASPTGVFIICFVYDVPINYEALAGKELPFYYPEIKEEE